MMLNATKMKLTGGEEEEEEGGEEGRTERKK